MKFGSGSGSNRCNAFCNFCEGGSTKQLAQSYLVMKLKDLRELVKAAGMRSRPETPALHCNHLRWTSQPQSTCSYYWQSPAVPSLPKIMNQVFHPCRSLSSNVSVFFPQPLPPISRDSPAYCRLYISAKYSFSSLYGERPLSPPLRGILCSRGHSLTWRYQQSQSSALTKVRPCSLSACKLGVALSRSRASARRAWISTATLRRPASCYHHATLTLQDSSGRVERLT